MPGVASCVRRTVCVARHDAVRRRRARTTHRPRLPPVRASAAVNLAVAAAVAAAVPLGVLVDAAADGGTRVQALTNSTAAAGTRAYVARPGAEECAPVVVVLHQFYGLTAREVEMCDDLARLGYVAVAPDMFGGESTGLVPRAIWLAWNAALRPGASWGGPAVEDVVAWLGRQPYADTTRLCCAGFCVGGGAALRWADSRPTDAPAPAVAVFYGRPLETLNSLRGPVLGIFGTQDSQFPAAQVDAFEELLRSGGVSADIRRYEGEGHAFVTDLAATRRAGTPPAEAWQAFTQFLNTSLRS